MTDANAKLDGLRTQLRSLVANARNILKEDVQRRLYDGRGRDD